MPWTGYSTEKSGLFSPAPPPDRQGRLTKIKQAGLSPRLLLFGKAKALVVRRSGRGHHVHPLAPLVEMDLAIDQRKQRPITARAYVLAR